jgi:biopolymer transport protein ExbB/TolQ
MREWRFVIAAYVVTWVVLIGYSVRLFLVNRRAAAVHDESVRTVPGAAQ